MSKLLLTVFEAGPSGPAAQAANAAFDASPYIEGTWLYDTTNPASIKLMNELGVTAPAIVLGRYCPGANLSIKHIAKMPGVPGVQKILKAVEQYRNDPTATNCNIHSSAPLPSTQQGSGSDDGSSGSGLNPWGVFSLPFDLPWWIWVVIAGGAAIGANSSRTKPGMYAFGGVAVLAAGNAYTSYKKANG